MLPILIKAFYMPYSPIFFLNFRSAVDKNCYKRKYGLTMSMISWFTLLVILTFD